MAGGDDSEKTSDDGSEASMLAKRVLPQRAMWLMTAAGAHAGSSTPAAAASPQPPGARYASSKSPSVVIVAAGAPPGAADLLAAAAGGAHAAPDVVSKSSNSGRVLGAAWYAGHTSAHSFTGDARRLAAFQRIITGMGKANGDDGSDGGDGDGDGDVSAAAAAASPRARPAQAAAEHSSTMRRAAILRVRVDARRAMPLAAREDGVLCLRAAAAEVKFLAAARREQAASAPSR